MSAKPFVLRCTREVSTLPSADRLARPLVCYHAWPNEWPNKRGERRFRSCFDVFIRIDVLNGTLQTHAQRCFQLNPRCFAGQGWLGVRQTIGKVLLTTRLQIGNRIYTNKNWARF